MPVVPFTHNHRRHEAISNADQLADHASEHPDHVHDDVCNFYCADSEPDDNDSDDPVYVDRLAARAIRNLAKHADDTPDFHRYLDSIAEALAPRIRRLDNLSAINAELRRSLGADGI